MLYCLPPQITTRDFKLGLNKLGLGLGLSGSLSYSAGTLRRLVPISPLLPLCGVSVLCSV